MRESSESSRPTSPDTSDSEEFKSDNDFDTSALQEVQISGDQGDDLSLISGSGRGLSEESEIETPNESDENISIATSGISGPEDYEGKHRGPGPRLAQRANADAHSRGLPPTHGHAFRETIWRSLCGSSDQDILPFLLARDQWRFKRDITFPSRKSLAEASRQGVYGNVSLFGVPAEDLRSEATTGWNWYHDVTGLRFRKRQRLENIDDVTAQIHIAFTTEQDSMIVMGPTKAQQAYHLSHLSAMDFGQAWEKGPVTTKEPFPSPSNNIENIQTSSHLPPGPTSQSDVSRYREGWLLNLGSKIQTLAWAPNRHGDGTQYLAVSTSCSSAQRNSVPASTDRRAPAFRPSPPYPSSIQIWAFRCAPASEGLQKLDMTAKPRLVQVLCTLWGNIRQLQWCPVLRDPRDLPEQQVNQAESTNLGLLGVISSDGDARILDVSVPSPIEIGPQYLSVKSAAFDAASSSSIYTCLSFVSPTDLLCGTASGSVDLFNIPHNTETRDHLASSPTPYLTVQQSLTYILTLSPAYPSPFPNLLASTSMSGIPILSDLRSPSTDKVLGTSARIANKNLVYSPHLRSYLFTSEGDAVIAYPIRRFFAGVRVARFMGQGTLTALATSRWHPCLLMGTSGGTVSCTNPLRRVIPSTKRGGESGAWVQKLCESHWVPRKSKGNIVPTANVDSAIRTTHDAAAATPTTTTAAAAAAGEPLHPANNSNSPSPPTPTPPEPNHLDTLFHGPDTRPGTTRFHEGFRAEKQDLSSLAKQRARGLAAATGTETIYEEEQAVTAAEWNPNLECSGWVAVGWGGGVVRVQDLGYEEP